MEAKKNPNTNKGDFSPIDVPYMNEMITRYNKAVRPELTKIRRSHTPEADNGPDATSAWVSIEELKAFLAANESADVKATGVRVYYGVHTRSCVPNGGKEQLGYHNIILVPTKCADGEQPTYQNSFPTVPIDNPSLEFFEGSTALIAGLGQRKIVERVNGEITLTSVYDSFPLCPPNCPK